MAQHYGLETNWLDITGDFNVALFMATCKWDQASQCWLPLKKEDTEVSYEKQHGVLFHITEEYVRMQRMTSLLQMDSFRNEIITNEILPIGYQPFRRCHSQYAYGIQMKKRCSLQEDIFFEKLHFRHNEKLSQDVFDMMNGGESIYPKEGLNEFADVIEKIKCATSFSKEALEYAVNKNEYYTGVEQAENALLGNQILGVPVKITGDLHPYCITSAQVRSMNREYDGFNFEKAFGIKLLTRLSYIPKHSV